MILLAIDTAGVDCAVGLYDSDLDRMLAARSETIGRGHAEKLMGMIDAVLDEASTALTSVERVAVTIGPGSFTGIRVGLSAARGLALALGVDIVGITTLAVLAAAERRRGGAVAVLAAMDAKRDEVYVQGFSPDALALDDARLLSVEEFRAMAAEFARHRAGRVTGSACRLLEKDAAGEGEEAATVEADHFPMQDIVRLGAVAQASGKPKPLYLRGPDVKPQAGFAVARA
ncbi:tRNA (adenosine(37)-N6)-threonylcarbamoyltransferase complex dimerization subunit type 1 TsaB [Agrobacterium vitis]|uniref:tRNA (Adenosine(37)-N6)-threonylcarbamoyltransferase complex dimerization subunit type 1 TsaB n=1 Tax=Agrobacterium vitis TaxID=373 RepID=A0AAE4WCN6_AGRVI|nr:tRNA (adenosine(37)-N6)-threonylcarbamoyltransferase complex dimerization subunit type 1 TsaB [Agrobacterium vitis]MCF1499184.1 tRNA (adenosine(37)-N6)-threonylcarbamoyltransferase complex dimerization subunit type 1 TsaB [Allorhizobium sp. Av2]MCM2439571.1 tRNA (adenosine(37)-N6)-threonylcarbamoyltransferase complex dimerization subunit type 1 TsaB [Agrobacterium vitis]MUZ57530.1 tRNA (adenosine(37)-N6)-threonylcarbamoyltransferase complex dimerization subunit type 1 TsaB [Agrobacterium viti